jgi:hypothetical protein
MPTTLAALAKCSTRSKIVYTVNWDASTTADAKYFLEEATDSTFTTGLRTIYFGTASSKALTGRIAGKIYNYQVQAVKPGLVDSGKRKAANGCLVGP